MNKTVPVLMTVSLLGAGSSYACDCMGGAEDFLPRENQYGYVGRVVRTGLPGRLDDYTCQVVVRLETLQILHGEPPSDPIILMNYICPDAAIYMGCTYNKPLTAGYVQVFGKDHSMPVMDSICSQLVRRVKAPNKSLNSTPAAAQPPSDARYARAG